MFRVDVLWFDNYIYDPYNFFNQLWVYLANEDIQFLPHLGKFKPKGSFDYKGKPMQWNKYFAQFRPKGITQRFETLRKKLDPNNVFMTNYWEEFLFSGLVN